MCNAVAVQLQSTSKVPNLQVRKSQHMDTEFEGLYVQNCMQLIFPHLGWQAYTAVHCLS
jgi:hypothetical protein